jgi:ribokinase
MTTMYGFTAINLDIEQIVDGLLKGGDVEDFDSRSKDPKKIAANYQVVGEMNWGLGGAGVNVLAGIAMIAKVLGDDETKVCCIGAVGGDGYGEFLLKEMKKRNIDTKGVIIKDKLPSGTAFIATDKESGEREIYINPGANDTITFDEIEKLVGEDLKNEHYMIMTSFVCHKNNDSLMSQKKFVKNPLNTVFFDPGDLYAKMRYGKTSEKGSPEQRGALSTLFKYSDVLLANKKEIGVISGTDEYRNGAIRHLIGSNAKYVVVKLAKEGAYGIGKGDKNGIHVKAQNVDNPNSLGAGDAFDAGFIYAGSKGKSLTQCLIFGQAIAGIKVHFPGAQIYIDEIYEDQQLSDGIKMAWDTL